MQQAPHIHEASNPGYNPQDVKDLLFYVESWTKTVEHHHHTEETTMFPRIEELAGQPGLMSGPRHQHEEFHGGLVKLQEYAASEKLEEYRWSTMKGIIDSFVPGLIKHLTEEIDAVLGLEKACDSNGLRKVWAEAEAVAKANGNLSLLVSLVLLSSLTVLYVSLSNNLCSFRLQYDVFPLVLGNCDKTYEGGNEFPPLPAVLPYVIKYWFGRGHSGAWRFNPCDFWGKPVPLQMLPENRGLQ
jgi:hemerythrin-like domain-containing protein